ncbi:hypothetical protein NDU88_008395 [Pleurodeles waltl]|uniref:Uncharacterized protein n=1 Tax=Pleurodeles waltl TaxID=8319 RepID=A0AAV7N4W7_PLEWA|nr:hypothetical protein NDU88_008395 [Pleurodeles waltl]
MWNLSWGLGRRFMGLPVIHVESVMGVWEGDSWDFLGYMWNLSWGSGKEIPGTSWDPCGVYHGGLGRRFMGLPVIHVESVMGVWEGDSWDFLGYMWNLSWGSGKEIPGTSWDPCGVYQGVPGKEIHGTSWDPCGIYHGGLGRRFMGLPGIHVESVMGSGKEIHGTSCDPCGICHGGLGRRFMGLPGIYVESIMGVWEGDSWDFLGSMWSLSWGSGKEIHGTSWKIHGTSWDPCGICHGGLGRRFMGLPGIHVESIMEVWEGDSWDFLGSMWNLSWGSGKEIHGTSCDPCGICHGGLGRRFMGLPGRFMGLPGIHVESVMGVWEGDSWDFLGSMWSLSWRSGKEIHGTSWDPCGVYHGGLGRRFMGLPGIHVESDVWWNCQQLRVFICVRDRQEK